MPGFGKGPFGGDPFGDWDWARRALYQYIPEFYRENDPDGALLAYTSGTAESFTALRRKIRDIGNLRDPLAVRTQYDAVSLLTLGRRVVDRGLVEQRGVQASVDAGRALVTQRGRFTFEDVGKEIIVDGSAVSGNNRTVLVASVVDATTLLTDPPLSVDAGPLFWELRGIAAEDSSTIRIEVRGGDTSSVVPGWFLNDGSADFYILQRSQFQLASNERKLLTLREGTDGSVGTTGNLLSITGAFTQRDVGRRVSIAGSAHWQNEGLFGIIEVLSATEAVLDGSVSLLEEPGAGLHWAIRRWGEICVQGPAVPRGVVEQEGTSLTVASSFVGSAEVLTSVGQFSAEDIGKYITLRAAGSANSGIYPITAVSDSLQVTVDTGDALLLSGATAFFWELRGDTAVGSRVQVEARAQSLIVPLAIDYGISIDTRESEEYQRRWVASVAAWLGTKGTEGGYAYIGELTGYSLTASPMYKISTGVAAEIQSAIVFAEAINGGGSPPDPPYFVPDPPMIVGDAMVGKSGVDGTITLVGTDYVFTSPTMLLDLVSDLGRVIHTSSVDNTGSWGILEAVSSGMAIIEPVDDATDSENGTIVWMVATLYTDLPPTRPVYDEISNDRALGETQAYAGAKTFGPDRFCWDDELLLKFGGSKGSAIAGVSPTVSSPFPITYDVYGTGGGWDTAVGVGIGKWAIITPDAKHYMQTVPTYVDTLSISGVETVLPKGTTGTLDVVGAFDFTFSDPSANFHSYNSGGFRLRVTGSAGGNDGIYDIADIDSSTQLALCQLCEPATDNDANNGALLWEILAVHTTVMATSPPEAGPSTIAYECPELLTCDYCKTNKVLLAGTTDDPTEGMLDRLRSRLEGSTPVHVETVESLAISTTATLELGAAGALFPALSLTPALLLQAGYGVFTTSPTITYWVDLSPTGNAAEQLTKAVMPESVTEGVVQPTALFRNGARMSSVGGTTPMGGGYVTWAIVKPRTIVDGTHLFTDAAGTEKIVQGSSGRYDFTVGGDTIGDGSVDLTGDLHMLVLDARAYPVGTAYVDGAYYGSVEGQDYSSNLTATSYGLGADKDLVTTLGEFELYEFVVFPPDIWTEEVSAEMTAYAVDHYGVTVAADPPLVDLAAGTLTRATVATYWDGTLLTRYAAHEVRAIEDGVYLEQATTNEIIGSNNLGPTPWSTSSGIDAYPFEGPSGGMDATRLTFTTGTQSAFQNVVGLADNTLHAASLFMRAEGTPGQTRIYMRRHDNTNIILGDVTLTNSWRRYEFGNIDTLSGGTSFRYVIQNHSGLAHVMDVSGVQLEARPYASSLIETTVASATRNTDSLQVTTPATMWSQPWASRVRPIHDEADTIGALSILMQFDVDNRVEWRLGDRFRVKQATATSVEALGANPWMAGDTLLHEFDPVAGRLRVSGYSSGVGNLQQGLAYDTMPIGLCSYGLATGTGVEGYHSNPRIAPALPQAPIARWAEYSSFARASAATWWDATAHVLHRYASGELRQVRDGVYLEHAATNIIPYSNDLTNWNHNTADAVTFDAVGSGGEVDATTIVFGAATQLVRVTLPMTGGLLYSTSLLLRHVSGDPDVQVAVIKNDGNPVVLGNVTATGVRVRHTFTTFDPLVGGEVLPGLRVINTNMLAGTIEISGVQMEVSPKVTSIIETSGAAVLRAADALEHTFATGVLQEPSRFLWSPVEGSADRVPTTRWSLLDEAAGTDEVVIRNPGTVNGQVYTAGGAKVDTPDITWSPDVDQEWVMEPGRGRLTITSSEIGVAAAIGTPYSDIANGAWNVLATLSARYASGYISNLYRARTLFSPLDLDPVLWLDAQIGVTIGVGSGLVEGWADQSGNGNDFEQLTDVDQPNAVSGGMYFGTGSLNSRKLTSVAPISLPLNYGIWITANKVSDVANQRLYGISGGNTERLEAKGAPSATIGDASDTGTLWSGGKQALLVRADSYPNGELRQNNVVTAAAIAGADTSPISGTLALGNNTGVGNLNFQGYIMEVVIFDADRVGEAMMVRLQEYAERKYGF